MNAIQNSAAWPGVRAQAGSRSYEQHICCPDCKEGSAIHMVMYVLNNPNRLDEVLDALEAIGVSGVTIMAPGRSYLELLVPKERS